MGSKAEQAQLRGYYKQSETLTLPLVDFQAPLPTFSLCSSLQPLSDEPLGGIQSF